METIKLNIGSNTVGFAGFKNVDIRDIPAVDIVDDVSKLTKIEDNSVDYIKAHAILEHFNPDKTLEVLKVWASKLKSGGEIEISVPDGELIFDRYLKGGSWDKLVHSLFGNISLLREWHGEDAEKYGHHTLFSHAYLARFMTEAGLSEITEITAHHPDCLCLTGVKNFE